MYAGAGYRAGYGGGMGMGMAMGMGMNPMMAMGNPNFFYFTGTSQSLQSRIESMTD